MRVFLASSFSTTQFLDNTSQAPWEITDKATLHHVVTVQRLKIGQTVVVVHPTVERARTCTVLVVSKGQLVLQPQALIPLPTVAMPPITLVTALLKESHWDWLLQKATELGVRHIQPVITDFTVVSPQNLAHKLARWRAICESAAIQSEGLFIPTVAEPMPLTLYLQQPCVTQGVQRLVAVERQQQVVPTLKQVLATGATPTAYYVAVGPEGGWSDTEKAFWATVASTWQAVNLGNRILRTETAAIQLLGGILYENS
jgi:16S rRNA (uracil1498-N3)-methyltransferase